MQRHRQGSQICEKTKTEFGVMLQKISITLSTP